MSGRKESVKRASDPKLVKGYKRGKGSISLLYCFKKGLKFSIVGIFLLLLQSQMQNLASDRTKLIAALVLEVSGIRPKTTRLLRRQSLDKSLRSVRKATRCYQKSSILLQNQKGSVNFSASSWQNEHLMSSLYPILTKDTFVAKV